MTTRRSTWPDTAMVPPLCVRRPTIGTSARLPGREQLGEARIVEHAPHLLEHPLAFLGVEMSWPLRARCAAPPRRAPRAECRAATAAAGARRRRAPAPSRGLRGRPRDAHGSPPPRRRRATARAAPMPRPPRAHRVRARRAASSAGAAAAALGGDQRRAPAAAPCDSARPCRRRRRPVPRPISGYKARSNQVPPAALRAAALALGAAHDQPVDGARHRHIEEPPILVLGLAARRARAPP